MATKTVTISRDALKDLIRIKEDFDVVMESLELMENEEFLESYKKAKEEIKNREFVDWDEL
jgi:predicted CopG family antitoxin